MKDETRNDVLAAEPEQETKKIPQPEETEEPQYDLEEILEEALEEQYTPPAQEAEETPEAAAEAAVEGEAATEAGTGGNPCARDRCGIGGGAGGDRAVHPGAGDLRVGGHLQ